MSLERDIVLLSAGYALLGLLLLAVLTRARLPWPVKAVAIAVTSAFYIVVFYRTQGLLGWSALDPVPARFQLLWAQAVEPDLAAKLPGAIHIWVEELDDANLPSSIPRAYRLPYSPTLARKVEAARVEIMKGHPQGGRALDFGIGGEPGAQCSGRPARRRRRARRRSDERRLSRSGLPRRRLEIGRVRAAAGSSAAAQGRAVTGRTR